MSGGPRGSTRLLVGGMAAAGVVTAHLLAYVFAVPDPHHRELILESTGHRNWSLVTALALGALVAGFLRAVVGGLRGGGNPPGPSYAIVAGRLAMLQLGGFLALEALERLGVDRSVGGLLSEPAILLGSLLQIAIAFVGALIVLLVARGIEFVLTGRNTTPAADTPTPSFNRRPEAARRSSVGTGSGTLRGPPAFLVSP
ncbi:MAG: hypothetical protein ACRDLB_01000 [Actinomycetota bacterium]